MYLARAQLREGAQQGPWRNPQVRPWSVGPCLAQIGRPVVLSGIALYRYRVAF